MDRSDLWRCHVYSVISYQYLRKLNGHRTQGSGQRGALVVEHGGEGRDRWRVYFTALRRVTRGPVTLRDVSKMFFLWKWSQRLLVVDHYLFITTSHFCALVVAQ